MQREESSKSPRRKGKARARDEDPTTNQIRAKRQKSSSGKSPERIRIRDGVEFAPDDWDGRIKRCEERIEAGYAKAAFEHQLEVLKNAKATQPAVMKQFPGKSWGVIQRMAELEKIAEHLRKINDPCKELVNVEAILTAYENGKLEWDNNTTYWCQGKIIAGPMPFSFEDFGKFNTPENRGDGGFWVEGIYPLNMTQNACKYRAAQSLNDREVFIQLLLRLDETVNTSPFGQVDINGNAYPELELRFLEDTGSQVMYIFNNDMLNLMGGDVQFSTAPFKHIMGYQSFGTASGRQFVSKIIAVQVNMMGFNEFGSSVLMTDWTTIGCAVFDQNEQAPNGPKNRLNGPWLRKALYTGTAPTLFPSLFVGLNKGDLTAGDMLPAIRSSQRAAPEFLRPQSGVGWRQDPLSGLYYPGPDRRVQGKLLPQPAGSDSSSGSSTPTGPS